MPSFTVAYSIKRLKTLGRILREEAERLKPMTRNEMTAVREKIREQIMHRENLEHKQKKLHKKERKHHL